MKVIVIEAETRAIVSVCNSPKEVRDFLVGGLNDACFGYDVCLTLWKSIVGKINDNKPIPTLDILLLEVEKDDRTLFKAAPVDTLDDAKTLVDILTKYAQARTLYYGISSAVDMMNSDADPEEVLAKAIGKIEETIVDARSDSKVEITRAGSNSNADSVVNDILFNEEKKKIKTGFTAFDQSAALKPSQLLTISSVSGGGKSCLSCQLAINMYKLFHYNVCIINLEMSSEEVFSRVLSNISGVDHDRINLNKLSVVQKSRIQESWTKFNAIGEEHRCRFELWTPSEAFTASQLCAMLKPLNFDVIFIDYLNLVSPEYRADLWEAIGESAKRFKLMAKSLNAVVVMLCQLDEDTLRLKYAKSIRHHSDYVWTWDYDDKERESGVIEVIQNKARNSRQFPFKLKFDFDYMRFEDFNELAFEEKDDRMVKPVDMKPLATALDEDGDI